MKHDARIPAPRDEPLTLRILISYWYFKDVDIEMLIEQLQRNSGIEKMDVFADSGAFTAQSKGVHIDLGEYSAWIRRWEKYLTLYLNLDVIGNQEGTNHNQNRLEREFGLHPLPVFTFQRGGSDYTTLARQLDRYEYISLGGMVPFMGRYKQIMPHLIKCFKMAGDRAVFHGLGCTNWTLLKAFPFYSVDSSSWVGGVRYGNLAIFDERRGVWVRTQLGRPESFKGLEGLFARYGYNVKDFLRRETQQYRDVAALQALSYVAAERFLRRRHGLVFFPSQYDAIEKDCVALDPRHPQVITQSGGTVHKSAVNIVQSYLDAAEYDRTLGARGMIHQSGMKLYLANTVDGLYERSAEKLGELHQRDGIAQQKAGVRVYLADPNDVRFGPLSVRMGQLKVS